MHHVSQNWNSDLHDSCKEKQKVWTNNKTYLDTTESAEHTEGQKHLRMQQVIGLLREEFAFDGYLEKGVEELLMGNCWICLIG